MRTSALCLAILLTWAVGAAAQTTLPLADSGLPSAEEIASKEGPCAPTRLVCNRRVQAKLAVDACPQGDAYVRSFSFIGIQGNTVTLDLSAPFSGTLALVDPDGEEAARATFDGAHAELTHELPRTGLWRLEVRGADAEQLGDFDAGVECKGVCVASETAMCLNQGRFRVEVDWRDAKGNTGQAQVVDFGADFSSDDSGLFYFFNANNWEMLVKVLDACNSSFNSFWVFSAATTNVEYTLKVTDTQSNTVKTYFNPLGTSAPAITDTGAFNTCP